MRNDPYTLIVALDEKAEAHGTLYLDDEHTFAHQTSSIYSTVNFDFVNNSLKSTITANKFPTATTIERIVIVGLQGKQPTTVSSSSNSRLEFYYDTIEDSLTIRKPNLQVTESWEIILQ